MKKFCFYVFITIFQLFIINSMIYPGNYIPANHPYIRYFGRWDKSDSLKFRHSWPGVYIYAEFTGSSIGVRMNDNVNYYNVYIDGKLHSVFHGDKPQDADYIAAENLENGQHTFLFSKRNICFDKAFSFSGLILDETASLLAPKECPERKIEFIGDSYTAAEGNEALSQDVPWEEKFPVTNIDKGFAPVIARYYNAQYHTTCRSGSGMVCDWTGNFNVTIPKIFDRTLMEVNLPKWDFSKWKPDLVVICLGLNDYSGLKDSSGNISREKSELFRKGYHEFLNTIRDKYPEIKIIAAAAYTDWIRENVLRVVEEEKNEGRKDIFYSQFDYFDGGYVANGHPTVETHQKMAAQIIKTIDTIGLFSLSN